MRFAFFVLFFLLLLGIKTGVARQRERTPEAMSEIRRTLDMKVFHDRIYVKNMVKKMYELDASGVTSDPNLMPEIGHEGIFSDEDADIIRQEAAHKVVKTRLISTPWEERAKKIDEDPFEAFISLIEEQSVPDLKKSELDRLNSVDKRVIPEMKQMMTESGPSIGASPVPVIYNSDFDLR